MIYKITYSDQFSNNDCNRIAKGYEVVDAETREDACDYFNESFPEKSIMKVEEKG